MEEKHKEMGQTSVGKLLLKFSIPAIIGMLVNALYNVVDRIYIGNIPGDGSDAIAGVGVVFSVMLFAMAFCLLIGMGAATNISIYLGKKQKKTAEKFLGSATVLSFIVGIIIALITIFGMDLYIGKIGTDAITEPFAREYLTIVALGFPFLIAGYTTNAAVRSDGNPKISMITLLLGAITNIILDPIFIFVFNMGVKGAAIATVISQILSALWTIGYFTSKYSGIKLKIRNFKLSMKDIISIFSVGFGPFALQVGGSILNIVLNSSLMMYGGKVAVGSMTIVQSVTTFIFMPIFGVNQGLQPLLGFNYGAKLYKRVKEVFKLAVISSVAISTIGFIVIQVFAVKLTTIFTNDINLMTSASVGLKIFTVVFPLLGFQIISTVYFQAVGKPKITMFLSLSRQILFLIPLVYIFRNFWGVNGIWWAIPTSDILAFIVTFIMVRFEMKNLNRLENNKIHL